MSNQQITIETTIAAPVERVWQAYTTPDDITRWNFASEDWCCPSAEADVRVGGNFKTRMEARDGSFGFDFEGVYQEVEPGKTLAFEMPDGRKVRTTFEQAGDATVVKTVFDAETENSLEMQRDGWQAILDNFRRHVEA